MGKYIEDSKELLALIGGRTNIGAVTHCMTRMRFVLNDENKADIKGIESMSVVKGTFTQAGQFQVIIGNQVSDFYKDFIAVAGVEGVSKAEVKQAAKQNQNIAQRAVTTLAEIFTPLLPAIICGGLILGFRNVIDSIYMFENGTKTLVQISQFWAGVDQFLWLIGEAVFHTGIPVGLCWSVTKKMGGTEMLGIILGLTLTSGQLLNAYGVAGADKIPFWNFGFMKVNMIGYQAQVIPAIFAALSLVYLERFFKKIIPSVVSMIFVPFFSLLLSVIAAHFILGPIGWQIGSVISKVIYAGITGSFRVVFGAIFGTFYAPLVITGLHHMSNAIDTQLAADFGGTGLWPMIALSNIAQGSAVVGMILLQKRNVRAQEVNIPSAISCYLGVTEPAMFGVNLKYKFPFVCGMIGSGIAGIVCTATNTTANTIGVGGLPGILSIQTPYILSFALCMLIAIVIPIALVSIVGQRQLTESQRGFVAELDDNVVPGKEEKPFVTAATPVTVKSVVNGKIISLKDVNDGVFSAGLMGPGVAIEPETEEIVAPCNAKVAVVMEDTGHAVGLTLENGAELLIHVGLDTVYMNKEGFETLVRVDDQVKAGQPLLRFSKEAIKKANHRDCVMVIITDPGLSKDMSLNEQGDAFANETTIISMK
ncbi:MAG TPA: PTS trehalose transporter subunit IIBC [Kandleria vitulina]|nr:PTS trehalose transporter subunit IIBC [Kandleria vitulina]